jgi:hypothetical protein
MAVSAAAQANPTPSQPTPQPEIVRVRIVEGDVRIARGKAIAKETGGTWQQAVADLPLESGFNLTTGNGRAEIEFEDASTVYLDENSALSFDDLHTTNGVPHTEMTLLTGTATLHLQPSVAGETFVLRTLTDRIHVNYPDKLYQRVTGYLDAVAITRLKEQAEGGATAKATPTLTVFHRNGKVVEHLGGSDPEEFAAWDTWVANRIAEHQAAAAEVAQESGLPASTPGLADMSDEGVFFKCEPYGICWAPNDAAADQAQAQQQVQMPVATPIGDGPEFQPRLRPSKVGIYAGDSVATRLSAVSLLGFSDRIDVSTTLPQGFTCLTLCSGQMFPGQLLTMQFGSAPDVPLGKYEVAVTLNSGPLTHVVTLTIFVGPVVDDDYVPVDFGDDFGGASFPCMASRPHLPVRLPRGARYGGAPGYAWGVCHSGTWIYRHHGYVWVVGQKKHHHPPVHPIGCRGKLCYVPINPRDEKGKPPLNLKYTVYRPIDKKGTEFEALTLRPRDKVEVLAEASKEYLDPPALRLEKADPPKLQAHDAPVAAVASGTTGSTGAGSVAKTTDGVASRATASTVVTSATTVEVADLIFDDETDMFLLERMAPGMGGGGGRGRMVTETVEEHRESMRPVAAGGSVSGARAVAASGAHGTARAAASSRGSSGAAHASGGGSHVSSGGSHASAPVSHSSPPPAPAPAAHH